MRPSGQYLQKGIVMRQPLMLVVVHNGLIALERRMDVHAPHLTGPQYDGMGRQIQLGIRAERRSVLLVVYFDPISFSHGDLTLDWTDGTLVGGRGGFGGRFARESCTEVVFRFLGDG